MCLNRLGSLEIPGAVPGPPGQNGQNGSQGPEGPAGVGWITGQGIPTSTTFPNGTLYLDTDAGNVYQYDASTTAWTFITSIVGPQGDQGEQGEEGPTGGTGIRYRFAVTTAIPITQNNQVVSLGSASLPSGAISNSSVGVYKLCFAIKIFTTVLGGTAYPFTLKMLINNELLTTDSVLTFQVPASPPFSIKAYDAYVEAKIVKPSSNSYAPISNVTYSTTNSSGFFIKSAANNIDFSSPTTVDFQLISAATGVYSTSLVTSNVWIERYYQTTI